MLKLPLTWLPSQHYLVIPNKNRTDNLVIKNLVSPFKPKFSRLIELRNQVFTVLILIGITITLIISTYLHSINFQETSFLICFLKTLSGHFLPNFSFNGINARFKWV